MSFLKDVFKRKPGGTAVGNFIRGAVKQVPVVGSFLGNGSMMISQEDADKRDLTDQQYYAKYGYQKDGTVSVLPSLMQDAGAVLSGGLAALPNQNGVVNTGTNNLLANLRAGANQAPANFIKRYWWAVVFPVVGLIALIIVLSRRGKKSKGGRYGRY